MILSCHFEELKRFLPEYHVLSLKKASRLSFPSTSSANIERSLWVPALIFLIALLIADNLAPTQAPFLARVTVPSPGTTRQMKTLD